MISAFLFPISHLFADSTNRWEFDDQNDYEVSDAGLIRVNSAGSGSAELILQAQETDNSQVTNYLQWTRSGLSIGAASSVILSKGAGGAYNYPGVFRSRVMDKGSAGAWQVMSTDVDNSVFLSRSSKGEVSPDASGLVALYHLNNSPRDEISGQNGTPVGGYSYVSASILGSHAGMGWNGRNLQTVNSTLLNGATEISVALWIYPRETGAGRRGVIGATSGGSRFGLYRDDNGNVGAAFQMPTGQSYAGVGSGGAPLNTWSFIVMTWDGSTGIARMYVNGEYRGKSGAGAKGPLVQSNPIIINRYTFGGADLFCRLDEVSIWNRQLSDVEVRDMYLALSSVSFRVRSGSSPELDGSFVGADGTQSSSYLTGTRELSAGDNFDPFHRYMQYEAEMYSDAVGSDTPYLNNVKLITSDGVVAHDSSLVDFQQAESSTLLTNYPSQQATPYLGLARSPSGEFMSSGSYRSQVFDAGDENGFWQSVTWDSPAEIASDTVGLVGLWHLNGSWADLIGGVIGVPSGAALVTDAPKLGSGAVQFSGAGSGVTFPINTTVRALEFWVAPEGAGGGLLELNPGAPNRLAVVSSNGVLRLDGSNAAGIPLFVNGNARSRELMPGWNHVAIVLDSDLTATNMVLGTASGEPWKGLVDELALYDQTLLKAQVTAHFEQAVKQAGGSATARVRSGNALPLDGSFSGNFQSGQAIGVSGQQYFQYELALSDGGGGTPAVSRVRVDSSAGTFSNVSRTDFAEGAFGADMAWYGDSIQLIDLADRGAVGLSSVGTTGLLALWKMDEASWTTPGAQIMDSAGSRHGSPLGGPDTESAGGLGLYSGKFSDSGAYVALSTVNLPGDFLISVWFQSDSANRSALVATEPTGGRSYAIELNGDGANASAGLLTLVLNGTGGQALVPARRMDLNDGRWHHVAAQRRGQQALLYVDGVLENAATISGGIEDYGAGPLYMGRYGDQAIYFDGYLDDLSIWQRAMTAGEVGKLAQAGFESARSATFESTVLDAGGASVWETLRWVADAAYGQAVPQAGSGVIGVWPLDEVSGDALDVSGYGNPGDATAVAYSQSGTFSNAFGFNGSGAYVSIPDSPSLATPGSFTIEAWINPEASSGRAIVDKRTADDGYALSLDSTGHPEFWLSGSTCTAPIPIALNEWSHIVATYDGSLMRLYINGVCRESTSSVSVSSAGSALLFGRAYTGGSDFSGQIDHVSLHNVALGGVSVLAHYKAGMGVLKFQVRTSDSQDMTGASYVGPGKDPNAWFMSTESGNLLNATDLMQYLQYRGVIESQDARFSPRLYGVSVSVSRYPDSTPWVAVNNGEGSSFFGNLIGFNHDRTSNPNTDVRYQITGDAGASNRWFYYDSSAGAWEQEATNGPNVYAFQTSSKDDLSSHIGEFYEQVYDKTGGVFRFKAFLKSGGEQHVSVDWVEIEKSDGRLVVEVPNGIEVGPKAWISAVPYDIEWSWEGIVSDNLAIEYSLDGQAGPWVTITNGIAKGAGNVGSFEWLIPRFRALNSNAVIRIRDLGDATIFDTSDDPFEISQKFKVTRPNGGEYWYIGDTNVVGWESSFELSTKASIYMASDGSNFTTEVGGYLIDFLATNANASGENTYDWTTPTDVASLLTTNGSVLVQAPNGDYADTSDEFFTMAGIVITSPFEEGQKVKRNDPDGFNIQWSAVGAGGAVAIDLSLDGGSSFETNLFSSVPNVTGVNLQNWLVTQPESDLAVLRIRSLSDVKIVGLSKVFTIAGIDVTAPDGGEEWLRGSTNTIEWVAGGAGDFVSIYYTDYYDGTNSEWFLIKAAAPNLLSYDWIVSDRVSPDARVRIVSDEDSNLFSVSEGNFSIAGVRVTYPNLVSDTITMGQDTDMSHDGAPTRWLSVKLEISYNREGSWSLLGLGADDWTLRQPFRFQPWYPSLQTKVRATAIGATLPDGTALTNIVDVSDEYFTSAGLLLETPVSGSTNTLGQTYPIRWVTAGAGETATISLSSDQTAGDEIIVPNVFNDDNYPGNNSYDWTIPPTVVPTENATIKIVSGDFTSVSDPFILRGIRVTQPTVGDVWNVGSLQALTWRFAGVSLLAKGSISLSLDGGSSYVTNLVDNHELIRTPFFAWTIDSDRTPSTNVVLRLDVTSSDIPADIGMEVLSDVFTLKGIQINSPVQGDVVLLGATNTIEFVTADVGATATILYSPDGGASFDSTPIVANIPIEAGGPNSYAWGVEVDRTPSTNAVIRIVGSSGVTQTSGAFSLGGVRVDRPIKYDIWAVNELNPIQYISVGTMGMADLDLVYEDGSTLEVARGKNGPTDGSTTAFIWLLPLSAMNGDPVVSNVVLRVRDLGPAGLVGYSEPFKLVSQPRIEVVSPLEGDYLKVGQEVDITWVKGGHMDASDFQVLFSRDGFATSTEIDRDITFNPSNNTFVMPWVIFNQLGSAQLFVTNTNNASVTAYSGLFDIVGDLEVAYPNGDLLDDPIYAKSKIQAKWWTRGSVSHVNLFYRTATNAWVKMNDTPIVNKGGSAREQTSYQLEMPDVVTDSFQFRVQDANYSQTFDGTRPGPYDDSDDAFGVGYFTVYWEVGYYDDAEPPEFRYTDNLSVTDSSGWSESGLRSSDDEGQLTLIERRYPYGVYDTVWYRQFFNDAVDFRWLCNSNMTRRIVMDPSDIEPAAHVLATFVYDSVNERLTAHAWIERGGQVLNNPDSATVHIYDTGGNEFLSPPLPLTSSTVLSDGFFRMDWDNVLDTLTLGETYFARVEVQYNGVPFSAAVTYTLTLGAEATAVEALQAELRAIGNVLTNQIGELTAITTNRFDELTAITTNRFGQLTGITEDFRDKALARLGGISNQIENVDTSVSNLVTTVNSFSNTVVAPLAMLTNELVGVISPALTNISASVSNVLDNTSGDQARILNRPTTVEYGSTNTILYKTSRSLDFGSVKVKERNSGHEFTMTEVTTGLGIYGYDMIANWGTGSFTITCTDPNASDSIVLEVISAGVGSISALSGTIASMETQMDSMNDILNQLNAIGMGPLLDSIGAEISEVESAISSMETEMDSMNDTINQLDAVGLGPLLDSIGADVSEVESAISSMDTEMDSMSDTINQLDAVGLGPLLDSIGADVSEVKSAISTAVSDGTASAGVDDKLDALISASGDSSSLLSALADQLDTLISDSVDSSSVLSELGGLENRLNEVYGESSDASKFALSAKNEAGSAVTAVRELKELLLSGAGADKIQGRLDSIKSAIDAANANIEGIPNAVGVSALHTRMKEVAEQISEMATRKGYEYDVGLEQGSGEGGEGGDAADEDMITVLNENMRKMKISLDFMEKLLDDKINEPIITTDWLGVE